ncbi:hypothetical protein GOP47_0010446 [Adiantum capillus-veneris]|uniref:Uncharacterized protein n=1 Tax=Adiantum capillus-veneris TaxID=13818 RepID=A0A9D4ZIS9_ADICA|nr:hypothetical protein GOP47_0010446 [Adiantum capillus-veneris]
MAGAADSAWSIFSLFRSDGILLPSSFPVFLKPKMLKLGGKKKAMYHNVVLGIWCDSVLEVIHPCRWNHGVVQG